MGGKPLKSLIKEILEVSGCLVEENENLLEVLMPQEIAQRLGFNEHQILYFTPQTEKEGEFISYGSEVLDSISQLIADKGYFCEVHLPRLYLKKEGIEEIISRKLSLANSILKASWVKERPVSYLIFNFKYSAVSEEKKEGIISTVVNELTLASPNEMINVILKGYYEENSEGWEVEERRSLEEIFMAACKNAKEKIRREISDFERSLNRRLNKDVARLEEYYRTLREEIEGRIQKRGLIGEELERELAKIRAVDLELERKIKEQLTRYAIKVNVELLNVMRVTLPASVITVRLRRKDKEKDLALVWNPLLKDLELPVCEGCFAPLNALYLCDEKLHHLCHQCHECSACHKAVCHVCYPHACPRCGAEFQKEY